MRNLISKAITKRLHEIARIKQSNKVNTFKTK